MNLTNSSYKLLKHIQRGDICDEVSLKNFAKFTEDDLHMLLDYKFVKLDPIEYKDLDGLPFPSKYAYLITNEGISYIESKTKNFIRIWVPYLITTLISIGALIISIISLTK